MNLLVSNGPCGTSEDALPRIRWFGVIGCGCLGSDPETIPSGLELSMLAISNNVVCSSEKLKVHPKILCSIDLLTDLISDSLKPFWC